MKIKEVDKESKNTKAKHILPIASAGLGLGLTCFFMQIGVINYDNLVNFEAAEDLVRNIPVIGNLPFVDMEMNIVEGVIKNIGVQGIVLAGQSLKLAGAIAKPIKESDRVKNSKIYYKIKKIEKAVGIEDKSEEGEKQKPKTSKAVINLAKNALGIGAKIFLIATQQIDLNAVFDFSKLPHKLSTIAEVAKNVDMNKVLIGIDSVKSIGSFIKERRAEKKQGNIPLLNFKEILHMIGKSMQDKGKFPTIMSLKDTGKEMGRNEPAINEER